MKSNIGFFPLCVTRQHDGVGVTYQNGGPTRGLGGGSEVSDLALRSSEQDGSRKSHFSPPFVHVSSSTERHSTVSGSRVPVS